MNLLVVVFVASYLYQTRKSVLTTFPNTEKRVENMSRCGILSTDLYVYGNVGKHYIDSFPLSNWITKVVNTEKTRKGNLFIPRGTIPSKLTCKKIHAPDWLITSTMMQFGARLTSSRLNRN